MGVASLLVCLFVFTSHLSRTTCEPKPVVPAVGGVTTKKLRKVPSGLWGGPHIVMEVSERGAMITYDCAHGTIDQKLVTDRAGRFKLPGTHVREAGGPIRSDHQPINRPAGYSGRIEGKTMILTVTLTDTNENAGTFSLTYGEQPELARCL